MNRMSEMDYLAWWKTGRELGLFVVGAVAGVLLAADNSDFWFRRSVAPCGGDLGLSVAGRAQGAPGVGSDRVGALKDVCGGIFRGSSPVRSAGLGRRCFAGSVAGCPDVWLLGGHGWRSCFGAVGAAP